MDGPGILLGLCDQSEYLHQSSNGRADFKGQFWHEGEVCSSSAGRDRCKVQAAWKVGGAGPGGRGREEREGAVSCLFFPPLRVPDKC